MGLFTRLGVVVAVTIAVTTVGLLYAEVGIPLLSMTTGDGAHTGFLSGTIKSLETVVPLLLAVIELAVVVWFVVSSVQEERTVSRQPPR